MLNRGAVALLAVRHSGRTQEQIADSLGCSQPFVSRLLRGEVPKLAALRQAAEREYGIETGAWDEPAESEQGAA
jgi:transcriptional regulator with XRE-family HTH domain